MDAKVLVQTNAPTEVTSPQGVPEKAPEKASGLGALAGGILASSCCILPLALVSVGAGGAWLSNLTALSPYQPIFLSMAALSVGYGFWKARAARLTACSTDGQCAMPINSKYNLIGLWVGGGLAVSALAVTLITPLFS
ncbi:MAG: mercury transporter MerT [Rhodospirillaceae bacterium]|nr:mercury transporter MerT [Rhodospirillaceae bacterium]